MNISTDNQGRGNRGCGGVPHTLMFCFLVPLDSAGRRGIANQTERKSCFRQTGIERGLFVDKVKFCTSSKMLLSFAPVYMYSFNCQEVSSSKVCSISVNYC